MCLISGGAGRLVLTRVAIASYAAHGVSGTDVGDAAARFSALLALAIGVVWGEGAEEHSRSVSSAYLGLFAAISARLGLSSPILGRPMPDRSTFHVAEQYWGMRKT